MSISLIKLSNQGLSLTGKVVGGSGDFSPCGNDQPKVSLPGTSLTNR